MVNFILYSKKNEIVWKNENKTTICFRKTGLTEREDMVTLNHGK